MCVVANPLDHVDHREGQVRSRDGRTLFEQSWASPEARAAVVLVHGYGEHSGRYAAAARFLAEAGCAVQAFDLRGHGRSEGTRCFVSHFRDYLRDVDAALAVAAELWPRLPVFLMGHSLGGLICALFVLETERELDGLVLSAPSIKLGADFNPVKSKMAELLGRPFPTLPTARFRAESLSRDPEVVRAYREDELVFHGRTPARTASEINRAMRFVRRTMHDIVLPLLMMHGSSDRVTDPDGSRLFYDSVRSKDKSFETYDGLYHEIMNEPEKTRVLTDVARWLDSHVRQ